MQALCNQLMYEQSAGLRELKKLSFVWIERDPHVMQKVDVVRRIGSAALDVESGLDPPPLEDDQPQGIASTLLALIPASGVTDEQLEEEYAVEELELDEADDDGSVLTLLSTLIGRRKAEATEETPAEKLRETFMSDDDTMNQSFLDAAYNEGGQDSNSQEALDLQVYLTTKSAAANAISHLPFVHNGRPDVKELFRKMRDEAIAKGEHQVAVCVCAPKRLVMICQKACAKYSDRKVRFDFHYEVFD
jgi:hypothetical protein